MRNSILMLGILTSLAIAASGALAQRLDGWSALEQVKVVQIETETRFEVEKHFPDSLRAAAAEFTISGYVVPVLPEPVMTMFLLVERPEDCPFCGSGYGPSLTVEVHLARPMAELPEFSHLRLRGRLEFVEDPETMQLYRLMDAVVLVEG